jgi:hypothetical protein
MAVVTRTYSKAADFPYGLDSALLHDEIEAVIPTVTNIDTNGDVVTVYFSAAPDDPALAAVIAAYGLSLVKIEKIEAIDGRTRDLIAQGFTLGGIVFSLSASAQSTLLGLDLIRLELSVVYPIAYNSIDDKAVYSITNAIVAHDLFLAAVGTVRSWLDSGTALKDLVRAATTVAQVQAIVDNR